MVQISEQSNGCNHTPTTGNPTDDDIAVIGFSFKLPQDVDDVASFWDVLHHRRNLMTRWPESRMNAKSFVAGKQSKFNCPGGYFIRDDPAAFDAPFFSISAKEAAALDPMQRWTLETSYRAFENAGIPAEKLKGSRTAVFSASFTDDWSRMVSQDPENGERTAATGTASSLIPNRVSWYFDLRGPSVHIDTACSSSLFAVDMACQSLRAGECSSALVTGSSLILTPTFTHYLSNLGFLSPDSKCWAFDHRANGYARGEGFIALLLKPLSAALRDGDMIRSVIRATGSNQDGQTPSLTQPSSRAQEELIRHVYEKANLPFDKTRYVEAHVSLEKGIIPPHALFEKVNPDIDIEFHNISIPTEEIVWPSEGLRRISVNSFGFGGTNIHVILDDAYHYLHERGLTGNHCTAASANSTLNGLAKTTNGLANGLPNGYKKGQASGVHGYGNGHARGKSRLLVWSAADEKALKRTIERQQAFYKDHVAGNPAKLDQLAYTLATRRSCMLWRTFVIVTEGPADTASLSAAKPVRSSGEAGLAFVFTGQGAQYADMGWDLIHQYPLFAETLERIGEIYSSLGCEWDLLDELRNSENVDRPEYSQPLCTAVQVALVELLKSFNVVPKAAVGHSSGEIAAAYAIGALSLESACKVSYFRGQLAGKLRAADSGAMISVNLAEDEVPAYLEKIGTAAAGVSVACINSPLNCTLSGPECAIDAVKEQAERDQIFAQKLKTGVAYHSPAMLAIAYDYKKQMGSLEAANSNSPCSIPMVSTVTGKRVDPTTLTTARYWVENMVSPVRFADAIHALTQQQSSTPKAGGFLANITDLVEIGPTAALRRPVTDTLANAGPRAKQVRYASVLYRKRSAVETTLELAGQLFAYGHPVSITAVNQLSGKGPFLVDCPEYPFDHSNKYWAESRISRDYRLRGTVTGATLGQRVSDWNPLQPRWRNFLSVESEPWVADHNISNTVIYPAAGMLVMAMEAALQTVPAIRTIAGYTVKEARFMNPIVVGETWEDRTETVVELRPVRKSYEKDSTWSDVHIFCYRNKEWSECFSARIQVQYEEDASQHAMDACTRPIDSQVFYRNAADNGLRYGDWFQLLEDLHWDGKKTAVARIDVSKPQFHTTSLVHPAILDAIFHMLRASSQAFASASATNVPVKLVNAWFSASGWQSPQTGCLRCWGTANGKETSTASGEDGTIYTLADDGTVLMSIEHLITVAVSRPDNEGVTQATKKLLHKVQWKPHLSLLNPRQLTQACVGRSRVVKDDATALAHHVELTSVMNLALSRILRDMTAAERAKLPAPLERHMTWMEHHVSTLDTSNAHISDAELELRLKNIEVMRPSWKLHTNVVRELKNILVGDKDPLEVIFDSDRADVFYADMFAQVCDARLQNFLELAAHENPGLRILEVGARTGGFTGHILTALQSLEKESGGLRLGEYTYTDISPTFFKRARERWKSLEGRISFKTLDLERTLESQGFEVGSYDLLVAGSVLHATADLMRTLENVRTALKPGGRALILEVIAPEDVVANFSFGLVPGWWLARETWRKMSPLLNEEQWDSCLQKCGFSGNDLVLRDFEEEGCHICSIIVSTASTPTGTACKSKNKQILLVVDEHSQKQATLANLIHITLSGEHAISIDILSLEQFQETNPSPEEVVLCLASLDTPFLHNMTESKLAWLKDLMRRAKRMLWVSGGASSINDPQQPFYSQAQGFFRSLRLEAAASVDSQIVTLAVESHDDVASVIKVLQASFLDSSSSPSKEVEYVVQNGLLETCRVAEDVDGNTALGALLSPHCRRPSDAGSEGCNGT
ncbi:hypothetical protein QBC46DRAFT_368419 [Diplogelasinospora grovesii]|uniref:Polyketide synthase n=1 Tax=Diplogelasinospora grovesii TaxID=303347 RepID=A0AAN6MW86_9PEZI|nr:hypothetical protein QBC46DRAFT_368419 [Diplogelasinospora grovesii]